MRLSLNLRSYTVAMLVALFAAVGFLAIPLSSKAQAQSVVAPSGIDVASHQRPGGAPIDWNSVAASGQRFAYVKASEGHGWANDFYGEDVAAANAAGLLTGAYHYARPDSNPHAQANYFASMVNSGPATNLPPVLDLEETDGLNAVDLQNWTRAFLQTFEAQTGRTPMIYTYRYFWVDEMANTTEFSNYPLWLAAYQDQAPAPMGGWDTVSFWQRSETGTVSGVDANVDLNLFNGTEAQLQAFAAGNLNSAGGVFETMQAPSSDIIADLEQQSSTLLGDVLGAVQSGAAGPEAAQVANDSGLTASDAAQIEQVLLQRQDTGEIPLDQQQIDQAYEVVSGL
ncbi:glycoside hydrolase family 25 protein [Corynebacterium lubricantis]|uniref:glycoside hydrolase family 25 protein n=1 Tax=Corynebacterium lubricantis TaxID=541095 RepID=UPI0003A5FD4C|nr:glycoside hydrolase family 25 protein [Corynebacterium lubricantis]